MNTKGLTTLLLLASFIMLALISVKIIDNKDNLIIEQKKQLLIQDSLLSIQNYQLQQADSIIQSFPSYIPKDEVMAKYWEEQVQ